MKVAGFHENGGLSEFMRWPADHLIRVSDSIPDEHGALIEPTSVACHAIRKSGVRPGDNVAVVGCGTVGLLTIQVLKAAGANVSAVDIRTESLQLAKDFGEKEETFQMKCWRELTQLLGNIEHGSVRLWMLG